MLSVAILITVWNRRDRAIACLDNIYRQIDGMKAAEQYTFDIIMVDDGSTDGTWESVSQAYPSVKLIKGEGRLYWNGGMRLAWQEAGPHDFYLWARAGITLEEGALATIMETSEFLRHKAIVAGSVTGADGVLRFGGRTKSGKLIEPDPSIPLPCYNFNGHLVLVPESAHKILGNLDPRYRQRLGDLDYGVRAAAKGITRAVAPGILGTSDFTPSLPDWRNSAYPLSKRYKYFLAPDGRPPREQFLYDCRRRGFFYASGHIISLMFKVLFPRKK